MARGEHGGRGIQDAGGEVGLVGRAESDGDDVGAARPGAAGERGGELGRRVAHVVADDDVGAGGADLVDEAGGDRLDDLGRQLRADEPPHVVGLDERGQVDGRSIHAT